MKLIDLLAILGALAWTPHLFGIVKQWLTKSKIRVITQRNAEIGFTTFGPIFNIRLAFSVEHKDIVISDFKLRIKHESGEERLFEWQAITQQVGKMTTPDSKVIPYEKEQSVLAIKLNKKDIEERFIKFHETSFISTKQDYETKVAKKFTYLKDEGKYNPTEFLREPEMIDLYSFNKHAFPWKQGRYTVSLEIKSPEKFKIVDNILEFNLLPIDIEELSKNKDFIELEYKRLFIGSLDEDENIIWNWRHPLLIKT